MPCWVAPSIAAEIWGVPIELIMQRIKSGQIASKWDEGFLVVDVAPEAPVMKRPPHLRPPTFTLITGDEMLALLDAADVAEMGVEQPPPQITLEPDVEELPPGLDEESPNFSNWREARRRTSRTRIPPGRSGTSRAHAA